MRGWLTRVMVIAVSLLAIGTIVGLIALHLFRGTPQWYRHASATPLQRDESARRAFDKFAGIVNAAAAVHADHQPSLPEPTIDISFTDDELNALFEKWSNFQNWKQKYEEFVDDPIVVLRGGRILLVGRVKDIDTVVSIELDPSLDADGRLNLKLTRILGGRLPLPEFIARPYFRQMTNPLRTQLPTWQANAQIGRDGGANESLICASLSRLLIHTFQHESTDSVLFLPVVANQANVPVRIVAVSVKDHLLRMAVMPLDADARQALLQRIRANDPSIQ